jgi:biotin---protein ligase
VAPIVFIQYLAGLATYQAIKTYSPDHGFGYGEMPVRLKWPNDIYALDPEKMNEGRTIDSKRPEDYVKIGGVLVNSSYAGGEYLCVCGIGLNLDNALPTTSLNALLVPLNARRIRRKIAPLPNFTYEKLLARILVVFEEMYARFRIRGFRAFEELYYEAWLHSGQIVTLEGGQRARILGVTMDYGMLRCAELGWEDRGTGKIVELMTDGNSFDFFKGFIRRKV